MRKFKAVFKTSEKSIEVEINEDLVDDDFFLINGVKVEVDGYECLYIQKPEQYQMDNFIFRYKTNHSLLVLLDYRLDVFIPINISKKDSGLKEMANLLISINCNDQGKYSYFYELLGAKSGNIDMECALLEISKQLTQECEIEICACCKKSCWNPYGDGLHNHVCFKEIKEKLWQLEEVNKETVAELMNEGNFQLTSLIGYCEEFVAKKEKRVGK